MIVSGNSDLANELCKALGLDGSRVSRLELRVNANEIVSVWVEQFVTAQELGEVVKVAKRYALALVDPDGSPPKSGAA